MKIFTISFLIMIASTILATNSKTVTHTDGLILNYSDSDRQPQPPTLKLTVHGNPVKRVLRFEVVSERAQEKSIYLTNLLGRNILDIKTPKRENKNKEFYEVELDLDIPAGFYTLIVESGTERVVKRLQIL